MAVKRMDPEGRKAAIVAAAVRVAKRDGLLFLAPEIVADECEIETSAATVRRYFHTVADLRAAVCGADSDVAVEAKGLGL